VPLAGRHLAGVGLGDAPDEHDPLADDAVAVLGEVIAVLPSLEGLYDDAPLSADGLRLAVEASAAADVKEEGEVHTAPGQAVVQSHEEVGVVIAELDAIGRPDRTPVGVEDHLSHELAGGIIVGCVGVCILNPRETDAVEVAHALSYPGLDGHTTACHDEVGEAVTQLQHLAPVGAEVDIDIPPEALAADGLHVQHRLVPPVADLAGVDTTARIARRDRQGDVQDLVGRVARIVGEVEADAVAEEAELAADLVGVADLGLQVEVREPVRLAI
jgi:hypothetical protein